MNNKLVSAKSAYKRGLRRLVTWPLVLAALVLLISGYFTCEGLVTPMYMGMVVVLAVLGYFIYFIGAAPKWQEWMLEHSKNPKTTLELAMNSFLKFKHMNKLFLWGSERKEAFNATYQERIKELKVASAQKGQEKFVSEDVFRVHERVGNLWVLLVFEILAIAAGAYLLWTLEMEMMLFAISVLLLVLLVLLVFYTLRSIWKKNSNVLVISKNGIEVRDTHYGWDEVHKVDTVGEKEFYLTTHDGTTERVQLRALNKNSEEIEEAMLFFGKNNV